MDEDWEILHPPSSSSSTIQSHGPCGFCDSEIRSDYFSIDAPVSISIPNSEPEEEEDPSPAPSDTAPPLLGDGGASEIEAVGDESLAGGEDERPGVNDETDHVLNATLKEMEAVNRYFFAKMEEIARSGDSKREAGENEPMDKDEEKTAAELAADAAGKTKGLVWWKLPMELLQFCSFRMTPVWTVSIAAAFLGIVMLGRRMYRMKNKSRTIPLKIAIDDKKASQLMIRVAKLNEAFSLIKPVPLIRPSIPVGGASQLSLLPL